MNTTPHTDASAAEEMRKEIYLCFQAVLLAASQKDETAENLLEIIGYSTDDVLSIFFNHASTLSDSILRTMLEQIAELPSKFPDRENDEFDQGAGVMKAAILSIITQHLTK